MSIATVSFALSTMIFSVILAGGIVHGIYYKGTVIEIGKFIKIYKQENNKIESKSDDLQIEDKTEDKTSDRA